MATKERVKIDWPNLAFNENVEAIYDIIRGSQYGTRFDVDGIHRLIAQFAFGFNHSFASLFTHNDLQLSLHDTIVSSNKTAGWSKRSHCKDIMKTGIHYIEVTIDNFSKGIDLMIGISRGNDVRLDRWVGGDTKSYAISGRTGRIDHDSDSDYGVICDYWKYDEPLKTGDCIGVELNLNDNTLHYYKNGEYLGKAFDIQNPKDEGYVFAVSINYKNDQISIMH